MAGVGANLGVGFVDVVPSMRGIEGKLSKSLRGPSAAAGVKSGKSLGSRMAATAGRAVKTGLKVGAAAAGVAAGAAVVGGFKSAIAQQGIQATMTGLYGSASKASRTLQQIKDLSKTSPIDYEAYGNAANSLAYAGVEGGKATKILDQVGWAIVGAGGGATELDRAMQGLLKGVNNGGVVMNDTLAMISDSGFPIIDGLSAKFGKSGDEIKKMAAKGKISVEDVIDVMSNKYGPLVGKQIDGGKEKAKTFGDTWLRVKDNIALAIGEKMMPLLSKMAPVLGTIGDKIATWIEGVDLSPLVGWFEGIGKWVGQLDFSSWDAFTKSLSGGGASSALSSIFDSVKKLAPVFGDLFVSVQKSAPAIATLARGGIDILAGALKFLADHMDLIVKAMPFIIAGMIAWRGATALQTKMLAFQAPILAASNGLRLTAAILEGRNARAKIANTTATTVQNGAERVGLLTKLRTVAATVAQRTATIATSVATRAAAAGQWLFNAALNANPIGLIIAGIAALVAGLVWFFTKTKIGQTIIQAAWAGIKTAIGVVVNWFTGTVVPWFKAAINNIVLAFKMFKAGVTVVWNGFKAVLGAVWNWVKTYVFNPIVKFAKVTIVGAFKLLVAGVKIYINAWKLVLSTVWNWVKAYVFNPIKKFVMTTIPNAFNFMKRLVSIYINGWKLVINVAWSFVRDKVFSPLKRLVTVTIPRAFTLFKNLVKSRMENFRTNIHSAYSWVKGHTFDPLKNLITETIPNAFHRGVKSIGNFWGKLKRLAAKPVNFVIDTVYNNGIRKLWNPIAGLIGKDNWKLDKIGKVKGFRTGGKVWGAGTETSDSIPARLSRNEHVLTAKDVRNLGGHGSVYALRKAAAKGWTPGLAKGGTLSDAARWLQKQNVRITEFKPWGQNVGSHAPNSYHYKGQAFDANYGPGGQNATEMAFFDRIVPKIHKLFPGLRTLWRVAGHFNHLHVDTGKGGSVGSGGPGGSSVWDMIPGLKDLRDLKKKLSKMDSGRFGEVVGGLGKKAISGLVDKAKSMADWFGNTVDNVKDVVTSGVGRARGKKWAVAQGWPLIGGKRWKALDYIVSRESSWNPKAKNPSSTASGLGQFINATSRQFLGGAPMSRFPFDDQLAAVVRYTDSRYGGLGPAMNFWKKHHYYKDGGAVIPSSLSMMSGRMPKPHVFDGGGWLTDRMVAVHGKRQPDAVLSSQQWSDVHKLAVEDGGRRSGDPVQVNFNFYGDVDSRETAMKVVDDLSFEVNRVFRGGRYVGK